MRFRRKYLQSFISTVDKAHRPFGTKRTEHALQSLQNHRLVIDEENALGPQLL
jgi:hypothetical protein